jgi:pimeloyl-ACP methyl ester carboxylesterase
MPRTCRRRLVLIAVVVSAAAISACSVHTSTPLTARERSVQDTNQNVSFKTCAQQCTGEIDGAKYAIKLPARWNGTLLLYSHGYRFAVPAPPDFQTPSTNAQVSTTDTDGSGSDPLSQQLLQAGYALAGSSYKTNGWAVADGVKAGEALHDKFVQLVGTPKRTYVWGDSLGGLVTEVIAEQNPQWVDGAAPMCGVLAGPNLNLDLALDVAYMVKALIDPSLKLTGYTSSDEAVANWTHAEHAIEKAAADVSGGGTAKLLFISAAVDAPSQTATYDGHDAESQVKAKVESALTALDYGTVGRYDIEQRVGGDPSDNTKTDYAARISPSEASAISLAGGNVNTLVSQLNTVPRVSGDQAARAAFEKLGDTTGALVAPTVTMHTEADPLVIVQNEHVFATRVQAHKDNGDLVQLYIAPPASYSESTGAPYGAGHCNFTDKQRTGLVTALDNWVRLGVYPVPSGLSSELGAAGLDAAYVPPAWPEASVS